MSETTGRAEMERRLIGRSLEDESFRQRLLSDPRAAVEQELGVTLPEEVRVVAVEESADTVYLVLPSASPVGEGGDISDEELEIVAGGSDTFMCTYTCPPPAGATCATCGGCPG
jgi:hypothetical protein